MAHSTRPAATTSPPPPPSIDTSSPVSRRRHPRPPPRARIGLRTTDPHLAAHRNHRRSRDSPSSSVSMDGAVVGGGQVTAATGSARPGVQLQRGLVAWASTMSPSLSSTHTSGHRRRRLPSSPFADRHARQLHRLPVPLPQHKHRHPPPPSATTGSHPASTQPHYLANNPDVAAAGVDPATHYLTQGFLEGRNPERPISTPTSTYKFNSAVHAPPVSNPLTQFDQTGWAGRRRPKPAVLERQIPRRQSRTLPPLISTPSTHYPRNSDRPKAVRASSPAARWTPISSIDTAYLDHQLGASHRPHREPRAHSRPHGSTTPVDGRTDMNPERLVRHQLLPVPQPGRRRRPHRPAPPLRDDFGWKRRPGSRRPQFSTSKYLGRQRRREGRRPSIR